MSSFELNHPLTEAAAESTRPIDAARRGLPVYETGLLISIEEADRFILDPSTQILGFIEKAKEDPDSPATYKIGEVPSGEGGYDRVEASVAYPGRITRGLHKAISKLFTVREPRASLSITSWESSPD